METDPVESEEIVIQTDMVVRNIGQLVSVSQKPIKGAKGALQILSNAAIAVHKGRIVWIGSDAEADTLFINRTRTSRDGISLVDAQKAVVTPGFVDSHTHMVFAGHRAEEFHMRRAGTSYSVLLAQGKGILSTVEATRSATIEQLTELAQQRLNRLRSFGTTTVEIKTGYGLDLGTEEACLRIINSLNSLEDSPPDQHNSIRIVPTFLGAHTLPPEYRDNRQAYIDLVMNEMLPSFVGLAQFCDVFCEEGTFTVEESRAILKQARDLGYLLKIHAEQLHPTGAARLAAEVGAVSADHLDFTTDDDLKALSDANVTATLLPGCSYTMRTPYLSARRFLDHGLRVAIATDFNPGTSYCENMQMMLGLAMSSMHMSLEEALTAATLNGAYALSLQDEVGSIEIGKRCELAFWSVQDYQEIGYHFGTNLVQTILVA